MNNQLVNQGNKSLFKELTKPQRLKSLDVFRGIARQEAFEASSLSYKQAARIVNI